MIKFVGERLDRPKLLGIGVLCLLGAMIAVTLGYSRADAPLWLVVSGLLAASGVGALTIAPGVEASHLVAQAHVLINGGQFQPALDKLDQAIRQSPRLVSAYIARSAAHAGLSQLDLALDDAERAVKIAPTLPAPRLTRARLYSYRGLHDDAIRDLRYGILHKPDWATGYLELAQLHVKLQDYESSLATLRDLEAHITSEQVRYDSLILTGWLYEEKLNNLEGAIAAYTRAIPLLPDRKIGYLRRAHAYRERGDKFQAAEDLLRAAQRIPTPEDDGQYHWMRAACFWGRYTITGDQRDLIAWLSALEQSVREDSASYKEQSRRWLAALRDQRLQTEEKQQAGIPPKPVIYLN